MRRKLNKFTSRVSYILNGHKDTLSANKYNNDLSYFKQ